LPDTHELFGQWRMEVMPSEPAMDNVFLHLIQVGDQSVNSMVNSTALTNGGKAGLKFAYQDKEYEIMFNVKGDIGGRLSIRHNGQQIVNVDLTEKAE